MTEALAQLQSRNASASEIAAAKKSMEKVRKEIAKFHTLRRKNNEIAAGLRITPVGVDPARAFIAENRDAHLEQQAVALLRQFLQIVHGREPTKQEMKNISPMMEKRLGMGVWPAVIAVGLTTVGLSVHQVFSHLREQEERIFLQTASPMERVLYLGQKNLKSIAVIGVAGTVGYVWYREAQREALREGERPPGVIEALSDKIQSFFPGKRKSNEESELAENPEELPEIPAVDALDLLNESEKKEMVKLLCYYFKDEDKEEKEKNPEEEEKEEELDLDEYEEIEELEEEEDEKEKKPKKKKSSLSLKNKLDKLKKELEGEDD